MNYANALAAAQTTPATRPIKAPTKSILVNKAANDAAANQSHHKGTATASRFETLANILLSGFSAAIIATSLMTLSAGSLASANVGQSDSIEAIEFSELSNIVRPSQSGEVFINVNEEPRFKRREKALSGWAVSIDNDILVPSSRDQDYTYGSSISVAGKSTRDYFLSLDRPLSWLNQSIGISAKNRTPTSHGYEVGLYGFTPEDTSGTSRSNDDRPYASIVYWSSSQELATASPNRIWRSTLTVGIMGLDIVGDLQNEVHRITDSDRANGWDKQISDGGELTARYSIAKQIRWDLNNPNIELKTSTQASLGYLTEVSWGASLRMGKIASRWQSYNPELTAYGEQSNQSVDDQLVVERYFLLGAAIKARSYNAFLQGQFRDNDFDYSASELNHAIFEAWAGYSHSFRQGYRVSYLLRAHSSEVKRGRGDRNLIWGGLTLSKAY